MVTTALLLPLTCEEGQQVVHVVVVVVLDTLVPERRERHGRGVQPRHVGQQPVGGVAPGVAELHHRGEGLLSDVDSRVADEVEEQVLLVLHGGNVGK